VLRQEARGPRRDDGRPRQRVRQQPPGEAVRRAGREESRPPAREGLRCDGLAAQPPGRGRGASPEESDRRRRGGRARENHYLQRREGASAPRRRTERTPDLETAEGRGRSRYGGGRP